MGVHVGDNKCAVTTEQIFIHFDLPKDVGNDFEQKSDFIKKWFYQK